MGFHGFSWVFLSFLGFSWVFLARSLKFKSKITLNLYMENVCKHSIIMSCHPISFCTIKSIKFEDQKKIVYYFSVRIKVCISKNLFFCLIYLSCFSLKIVQHLMIFISLIQTECNMTKNTC